MSDLDVQDYQYLGREFLTWLLWMADQGEASFKVDDEPFEVSFVGRVRLTSITGDVTAGVLDGRQAAYSVEARAGIGAGRTIREAMLRFVRGEKEWTAAVADSLDLRAAKLPALLAEEEDDRFLERMALLEELQRMVGAAFSGFMQVRGAPPGSPGAWHEYVVPAIRAWVTEGLMVEG